MAESTPGLICRLRMPIDAASLAIARIAFGLIMVWEVCRYFTFGWIRDYYIDPELHFTYYGFGWVRPWPGEFMYLHFALMGVAALCIALGLFYRLATVFFFLAFTFVFLLDQAYYLNHFYLISLVSFLFIFVPAHRMWSLDARYRPAIRNDSVPTWSLWIMRFQVGVAYFYGGIAKLNQDWLQGEPLRTWLAGDTDFPVIGQYFTEDWMIYLISYSGLAIDLLVVPLLLWRRTRVLAYAVVLAFNLSNAALFYIGVFPWMMIALTTLYFDPSWPRRILLVWRKPPQSDIPSRITASGFLVGVFLCVYVALQVLMPLRHWLYPGNPSWTEEGHRFAWHMKLRTKDVDAKFFAHDHDNDVVYEVDPLDYLTHRQAGKMEDKPDMILQFCHFVADDLRRQGVNDLEVRASIVASLNARPYQLLIDPDTNLAAQKRSLRHAPWIVLLGESEEPAGN